MDLLPILRMIMPNSLVAFHREMTGSELKEYVRSYVEGVEDENGFTPFNRGSLPVVSGISIDVQEGDGFYTLIKVKKDGKEIKDGGTIAEPENYITLKETGH